VLVVSHEDVAAVLDLSAIIAAVEDSLAQEAAGRVSVPTRTTMDTEHGWFRVMPGALSGGWDPPVVGAKIMALARGGGLSYLLLLYDELSGNLLAMMDAAALTQLRTGAISAVFLRRVLPGGAALLGLFGSGFQARGQLEMIAAAIRVGGVRVYSPRAERRQAFAGEMTERLGIDVEAVDDPKIVARAPLVVLATRTTAPALSGSWLVSGTVVVSIGSTRRDLREVDVDTFRRARCVIVDHAGQALAECGDILAALEAGVITNAHILPLASAELASACENSEVRLFKPSGSVAQDLAVGRMVYEECVAKGIGTVIPGFLERKAR
jgi:ornithine cyclodeaminase/alanine dehydrogenase